MTMYVPVHMVHMYVTVVIGLLKHPEREKKEMFTILKMEQSCFSIP